MDEPPCGDSECKKFLPEQVLTIHHAPFDENFQRPLTCTGEPSANRVRMSSTPFATTCPLCLDVLKSKQEEEENSQPEPEEVEEVIEEVVEEEVKEQPLLPEKTLKSIGFPEHQIDDVKKYAKEKNLPLITTPTGLLAWVNEGNDITLIPGIGDKSRDPLLKLLNEGI